MRPARLMANAVVATLFMIGLAACGSSTDSATDTAGTSAAGVRLVSPAEGGAIESEPPANLVVLDVRTPDEYAEGHLAGATLLDFYDDDFADQLAQLDPDVPYLLYCRSGNRSGQTAEMMSELGFVDVADVDGGIVAWTEAGLPVVTN